MLSVCLSAYLSPPRFPLSHGDNSLPPSLPPYLPKTRSVAAAAPQVYHTIAEAFTAALKCVTAGGTGEGPGGKEGEGEGDGQWGGRPALKDAAVRVSTGTVCRTPHERVRAACSKRPLTTLWHGTGRPAFVVLSFLDGGAATAILVCRYSCNYTHAIGAYPRAVPPYSLL